MISSIYGSPIYSVPVYVSPHATEKVVKTWIDKVLEWNPCNPWRKAGRRPAAYMFGGKFICHPTILQSLRDIT